MRFLLFPIIIGPVAATIGLSYLFGFHPYLWVAAELILLLIVIGLGAWVCRGMNAVDNGPITSESPAPYAVTRRQLSEPRS